jgi:phosphoglycerol transferase MdoB-like AlkP superfamily enzyme
MNQEKYKWWSGRMLSLLICFAICRVLFFALNTASFSEVSYDKIGYSFLLGIRFDASAIVLCNIFYTILVFLPFQWITLKSVQIALKGLYFLINIPMMWINIADSEYYKFTGRRTIIEVLDIANDVLEQSPTLLLGYWYLVLIWIVLCVCLWKSYRYLSTITTPENKLVGTAVWLIVIGLNILIFRGGLQTKPIRTNNAFIFGHNALGNLTLNTPFTFLTSIDAVGITKVSFFEDETIVKNLVKRDTTLHFPVQKTNVVIIILESFAREFMGYKHSYQGYTPFLDSLAKKGIFFNNAFSNGRESIMAVPAVTAIVPQLMAEPYITSAYQSNNIRGIGNLLSKHGYSSAFFHGARNGSMGFEAYARLAGFQSYYGLSQYPEDKTEKDFDGTWGIADEPYLQYVSHELTALQQPFVSTIFTLSSHFPYTIPDKYKGRFSKGDAPIHESIGYADYALKQFFAEAQKQSWYNNTLFILTADHTQANTHKQYATATGAYRVPLIFYHPNPLFLNNIQKVDTDKIVQHTDIVPSILDFLGIKESTLPFGESVFATTDGYAFHYESGNFRIITKKYYVEMNADGRTQLFDIKTSKPLKNTAEQAITTQKLKAFVQYFKNGLIDNSWEKNDIYKLDK